MTAAPLSFSEALKTNHLPLEPYAHLPGIQLSPHGLLYIPLNEPCSEFCLTNYLASPEGVESDAESIDRIMGIPSVRDELALFVGGGSMSVEIARENIRYRLEVQKEWCMPVIRLTADVCSGTTPRLIGQANLYRNTHRAAGIAKAQQLSKEDREKSDREVTWGIGCWLDPSYGKRGVMTAAYKYIIRQFYLPYLHTFPGQLTAGLLGTNQGSAKLQHRLGFKTVAKSYWPIEVRSQRSLPVGDKERWRCGCSLWQGFDGEYSVRKEESIFRDFEDWDGDTDDRPPTDKIANGA